MYWQALPWDHLLGALVLTDAGGAAVRPNGRPYRASDIGQGLIAASHRCAELVRKTLLSEGRPP